MAYPVGLIDDYGKHIFREHNQEANITTEGGRNTEEWKAVSGYWDGSKKTDGRSGCGVVTKGIDRDMWITISKIAVHLEACTTMAAEIAGASVLTGLHDLLFDKNLSVDNINRFSEF